MKCKILHETTGRLRVHLCCGRMTLSQAEMAYGKLSQPGIPGGSTLIFDMELLSVY